MSEVLEFSKSEDYGVVEVQRRSSTTHDSYFLLPSHYSVVPVPPTWFGS